MIKVLAKPLAKSDLCQISLTGIRAVVLLGLLMRAPRSLNEIREIFINENIMDSDNSNDILRIDINTLRSMGCEISRASQKTNGKYVLLKHPFVLNITQEEIAVIRKAFKALRNELDITKLINYDILFKKIAEHVQDDKIKEEFYGLTALKSYDINLITSLVEDCQDKRTIEIIYNSPVTRKDENISVLAEEIVIKNDKIYLYGYSDIKGAVSLNIKRIKKILSRSKLDKIYEAHPTYVKFLLKDFGITGLENNEKVIENTPQGYIIEGEYFNEFLATQRILSLGASCTIIEPNDFKEKIIDILKRMRSMYNA